MNFNLDHADSNIFLTFVGFVVKMQNNWQFLCNLAKYINNVKKISYVYALCALIGNMAPKLSEEKFENLYVLYNNFFYTVTIPIHGNFKNHMTTKMSSGIV